MIQYHGKKLNDNKWHTILAEKYGNFIGLTVDNDSPVTARFDGSDLITNTNSLLYIGGLPPRTILVLQNTTAIKCFDF